VKLKRQFLATGAGRSLLLLSAGSPSENPIFFQVVQTLTWDDQNHLLDNVQALVGTEIQLPAYHNPACGGPFVYWLISPLLRRPGYYDRTNRTGPIIPVNIDVLPNTQTNDLVIVYYEKGARLRDASSGSVVQTLIDWPWKPVRYTTAWPTVNANDNFGTNIIANICDKEIINAAIYRDWDFYVQNDPAKPGFNPNDEHVLRKPWGVGEAMFPLRDDLGTPDTSEPYILMKYQNPNNGLRGRIKVFKVVATNDDYSLTAWLKAGSLLQPPFPLVLLPTESLPISGPYWEDRKGSFWATAAGDHDDTADIVVHYRYPVQPTFYFPGNNPPPVGALVPWLDGRAGTLGTAIDFHFGVYWPDRGLPIGAAVNISCSPPPAEVPELRVGETLVKPKFGLPDISSQSSVEVVYQQATAWIRPSAVSS